MFDAALGTGGLVLAFTFGVLGSLLLIAGAYSRSASLQNGGRIVLLVGVIGSLVSVFAMEQALIGHDFHIAYVVANNSKETPLLFDITGMWSALQGSLLLWAVVEGLYALLLMWVMRNEQDRRTGSVALAIVGVIYTYFIGLMLFSASPFVLTSGPIPADGRGPDPLLQEYPLVAIHPPMLYAGFVGMSVPFALMAAALLTGRLNLAWISRIRNWSLLSWAALTTGIVLGAWWSYQVLGWGGYWAWDPVENSALLPWLTATAFIHSVVIDRRNKRFGVASFTLVAASFSLTILATYFTRSGVLQSVHAFSDSSLGTALIAFFAIGVIFSLVLAIFRADLLMAAGRRSTGSFSRLASRGGAMLINNTVLGFIAIVILAGTVFPLIAAHLGHQSINVGAPFFDRFVVPLGLLLLAFMAVGPWLRWEGSSGYEVGERLLIPGLASGAVLAIAAFAGVTSLATLGAYALGTFVILSTIQVLYRKVVGRPRGTRAKALLERSSAGMIVHIGVAIVALGMASATTFGHQGSVRMRPGQTVTVYGQKLTYLGVETVVTPAKTVFMANVRVNDGNIYHPAISQFGTYAEAVGTPGINVSPTRDVYLTIDAPPKTANGVITLGVVVQPLIFWLWTGAMVMIAGAFLAAAGYKSQQPRRGIANDDKSAKEESVAPVPVD
jgi:cytochrome c-type biogenesis protein CcmF